MPHPTKIATCCFCGSRTLLKPTARHGHELACGSCGAPLHEMKWLKIPDPSPAPVYQPVSRPAKQSKPHREERRKSYRPYKKRKKRKSVFRQILEEAWEIAEDIFD